MTLHCRHCVQFDRCTLMARSARISQMHLRLHKAGLNLGGPNYRPNPIRSLPDLSIFLSTTTSPRGFLVYLFHNHLIETNYPLVIRLQDTVYLAIG